QDGAQLADDAHGVRGGNNDVKVDLAALDLLSQIIKTNHVCASCLGSLSIGALGKHGHTNSLAGAVRQYRCATHVLVGFTWIHRSEEHTSELQSRENLVCRLLLEKKKRKRAS